MPTLSASSLNKQQRAGGWESLLWLVLFSFILVLFSYQFQWMFLRSLTLRLNLGLDSLLGVHWTRLSRDLVEWNGQVYRYQNACTFIDVWFGALPLIWRVGEGFLQNLEFLVLFSAGLLVFNIIRLTASDVLFAHGLPWWLAHDVLSGLAYFGIWCCIQWRRAQNQLCP